MDFIKEEAGKSKDYMLQEDATTKPINLFIAIVLIVLIIVIIVSGFYFEWF